MSSLSAIFKAAVSMDPICREDMDGTKKWWLNDKLHRDGAPAVIEKNGTQKWYQHGELHRDGAPAVIRDDGTCIWYCRGKIHRIDGPAIEMPDGTKQWFIEGKRHRDDGPAIENADGTKEYWLQGKKVEPEEIAKLIAQRNAEIAKRALTLSKDTKIRPVKLNLPRKKADKKDRHKGNGT